MNRTPLSALKEGSRKELVGWLLICSFMIMNAVMIAVIVARP